MPASGVKCPRPSRRHGLTRLLVGALLISAAIAAIAMLLALAFMPGGAAGTAGQKTAEIQEVA